MLPVSRVLIVGDEDQLCNREVFARNNIPPTFVAVDSVDLIACTLHGA